MKVPPTNPSSTTSPPPAEHHPPSDFVQALAQRKVETAKQKAQLTLTEVDANLLLTHSVERVFTDGQVVFKEGKEATKVYRVKSGTLELSIKGYPFAEFTRGYFLGESLLLADKGFIMKATIAAKGPVVLAELNVPFVKQLFKIDIGLSIKFMHYLSSKYARIMYLITGTLMSPGYHFEFSSPNVRATRKKCGNSSVYKVYPLKTENNTDQEIRLKNKSAVIVSGHKLGLKFKTSIDFTKLHRMTTHPEDNSVTLTLNPKKVVKIVFKNFHDREEFLSLVSSFTSLEVANSSSPSSDTSKRSSLNISEPEREIDDRLSTMLFLNSIQTELHLKKGDKIIEEGDLYQRVYILGKGTFNACLGGKILKTFGEGEVLGVGSLLHLRSCPVTLEVASDTATVSYIPAYKIKEVIHSDQTHAQQLYMAITKNLEQQLMMKWDYIIEQKLHHNIPNTIQPAAHK